MGFLFSKPEKKDQPNTSDQNIKQKKSLKWKRLSKSNTLKKTSTSTETLRAKDSIEKEIVSNRNSQDSSACKCLKAENENSEENICTQNSIIIEEEQSQKNSPAGSVYTSNSAMSIVLDGIKEEEWSERQLQNDTRVVLSSPNKVIYKLGKLTDSDSIGGKVQGKISPSNSPRKYSPRTGSLSPLVKNTSSLSCSMKDKEIVTYQRDIKAAGIELEQILPVYSSQSQSSVQVTKFKKSDSTVLSDTSNRLRSANASPVPANPALDTLPEIINELT